MPIGGVDVSYFDSLSVTAEEIDALIERHGVGAELRRAVPCPCARPETRAGSVACPLCLGLGRYYPPELREPVLALVRGRSARTQDTQRGSHPTGSAEATLPSAVGVPAEGDQLWPDCEIHSITEILVVGRQPFNQSRLRSSLTFPEGQRLPALPPAEDALVYPDLLEVTWAGWQAEDGTARRLRPGWDFDVALSADKRRSVLCWKDGKQPPPGSVVSVRYTAPAVYMIDRVEPASRYSTDAAKLPYTVTLSALFKLGRDDLR